MRIVNVHAHFYPRDYLTLLSRVIAGDGTPWGRAVQNLDITPAQREAIFSGTADRILRA